MRILAGALVVFVSALVLQAGQAPVRAAEGWDTAAAASYLDARMDAWWAKAKPLKTGDSEVKCLSCHTAVPYALARPALRIAMGQSAPTPHEERMLATVRQRVQHAATQQPYYDHTDAKKAESRGVEAVLNAVVLTQYDTLGRSGMGSDASRTAIARLWEVQRADGAWDWLNFGLEPYEANDAVFHGATLAAIAAGTSAGRHASQDATGKAGVERPRPGHAKGIAWLVANQKAGTPDEPAWAPWRAHSLNFDREHGGEKGEPWRRMFMSDLATAFAVLALTD